MPGVAQPRKHDSPPFPGFGESNEPLTSHAAQHAHGARFYRHLWVTICTSGESNEPLTSSAAQHANGVRFYRHLWAAMETVRLINSMRRSEAYL